MHGATCLQGEGIVGVRTPGVGEFCRTLWRAVVPSNIWQASEEEKESKMDTTAAAELGMGVVVGGGVDGIGYWGPGGTDQEAWATEEEFEEAAQLQADGIWNGGELYYRQQRQRQRQQKRSNGEPPLKKIKSTHGEFQGNHHHQGGGSYIGGPGYSQAQSYDGFDSGALSDNPNQGGVNSRSASATSGQRSNHNGYQVEFGQGASSGTPPPPPSSEGSSGAKSKGIGRMFFKTKLCCKFRAGTCPYNSNCNFAHGMEELRKPPPNWQEIVALQEEDRAQRFERRGEKPIPSLSSPGGGGGGNGGGVDSQRFHKARSCKKYYSEEGCPYGDRCNFLHDDQGRSRESVAISLGPTSSTGSGNELANGAGNNNNNKGGNGLSQKPMYWKTRICNKWETTGHCPFGDKCRFAHGSAELQKYGGGFLDSESGATSAVLGNGLKQSGTSSKPHMDPATVLPYSIHNTDNYAVGISNQRSIVNFQSQRQGQIILSKWKGPDKISRIYGDWIDDNEWGYTSCSTALQTEEASQVPEKTFNDIQINRDEKCYNSPEGQPNVPFFKGRSGHSSQNLFLGALSSGGKDTDMTAQGGSFDGIYEDDACAGDL